jgi:hypothetical protein
MYCIECGAKLPNNSKFCPNCGTKISNGTPPSFNNEISESMGNVEIPVAVSNQSNFDYIFFKKAIGWYSAWVLIHLGLLLIAADEIISSQFDNDRFWPFSSQSRVENYDIREFLVFTIFPLAIIIIWSMIHPIDSINLYENIEQISEPDIVYRKTTDSITLKIVSINNQSIGAEVFINELYAPDGEYDYLDDNRRLIVKNGKIEKLIKDRYSSWFIESSS